MGPAERLLRRQGYEALERSFIDAVHDFWASNDESSLARAVDIITPFAPRQLALPPRRILTLRGWVRTRGGARVRRGVLRRLNPGYRIKVRRHARPDTGRFASLARNGFEVTATGPIDGVFTFAVSDKARQLWSLPGSSPETETQTSEINGTFRSHSAFPIGYIDTITESLLDPADRRTWLPHLASAHPQEMFEVADSRRGESLAVPIARAARLARAQPFGKRWSDRLALAAYGEMTPNSDLTHLRVVRPNPHRHAAAQALMLPEPTMAGDLVELAPGATALPVPSDEWLEVQNARVQDGGTVLTNDDLIAYEAAADPTWDFVGGQWHNVFGSSRQPDFALVKISPPSTTVIDEAILLSGRHDSNWYHWFVEYLPRALQADERFPADIPFLLTSRVPPTGLDALAQLSGRPIVIADPAYAQEVGRLHLTAPVVQVLDTTRVAWGDSLSANPTPLHAMRSALRRNAPVAPGGGERVFLRRKSGHRRVVNEDQLARFAERQGFQVVDPGSMSFSQQLDLFSRTDVLISAGGAVMANYLLLPPASRIIALTSSEVASFVLPAVLAQLSGSRFVYATGPAQDERTAQNRNTWTHSDFRIDPATLESAIRKVDAW